MRELSVRRGEPSDAAGTAVTATAEDSAPAHGAGPAGRALKAALLTLQAGPVVILVLLIVVLSLLSDVFLTVENAGNVMKQSAVISILALGQLLVILTRGIDLSVGATLSLSAVVGSIVWRDHQSAALSVAAMLATGMAVGVVNGLLYVKGRLPHPFIATLATLSAASGLALYLAHSQTIQGAAGIVDTIGSGRLSWIPGAGDFGWFPVATLVVVGVALLVMVMLRWLVWGRWVYAVGGSPEAAVRTGIPVGRC